MAGINNGGGEYREYIWPAVLPSPGDSSSPSNFYGTVKRRTIGEIYISNWYILAALVWTLVLVTIGYLPWYQNGLGETVIQGYYMHQGVGMWFMTFTRVSSTTWPSAFNRPIYSYSLGAGLLDPDASIPDRYAPFRVRTAAVVVANGGHRVQRGHVHSGSGRHHELPDDHARQLVGHRGSYVLPFFLVAVVFFVGSTQGSFQAFRFTNHSGISPISAWRALAHDDVRHHHVRIVGLHVRHLASAYRPGALPAVGGRHFWLAFIGLFAYCSP